MTAENFWADAPLISGYSRAQAIEDGQLTDVSDTDAARQFKYPAAITSALHAAIEKGEGRKPETFAARLFDVFWMMRLAARNGGADIQFSVKVGARRLHLHGNCGPGDDPAPVLTVGFPEDF